MDKILLSLAWSLMVNEASRHFNNCPITVWVDTQNNIVIQFYRRIKSKKLDHWAKRNFEGAIQYEICHDFQYSFVILTKTI